MQKLYFGGAIITMKEEERNKNDIECVLTEDGIVRFVGKKSEAEALLMKGAELIDLKGHTMIPAFVDAHSHISLVAQFSSFANLSECTDFTQIIKKLIDYKEEYQIGEDGIIIGCSYDHNFLEEQCHPTADILDQVSTTIPVFIFHISNHMGVANTKLLELAGIKKETKDPEGGKFGRDGDGVPNGYIEESPALQMVMRDVFGRVGTDFSEQIKKAQEIYLSNGITTVQDGASDYATFVQIAALAKKTEFHLDVISYIMADEYAQAVQECKDYDNQYQNNIKIGGVKIILDGSPQGKSAWLSRPYEGEDEYCGYPTHTAEEVQSEIEKALKGRYQILAHCNGDAAAQMYIDCYKNALAQIKTANMEAEPEAANIEAANTEADIDIRPVIIHAQTVRADQLKEMKELGMIPSFFIAHTYYWGDVHLKNLGQQRGSQISPARTALELGLKYNFHQDSPVLEPDMIKTLWCAVNRRTRTGKEIGTDQCISTFDALKGVTINAAYEYHEEKIKGTIEPGKLADFCILSDNPLEIAPENLTDIKVLETIKEDMTVYRHA